MSDAHGTELVKETEKTSTPQTEGLYFEMRFQRGFLTKCNGEEDKRWKEQRQKAGNMKEENESQIRLFH